MILAGQTKSAYRFLFSLVRLCGEWGWEEEEEEEEGPWCEPSSEDGGIAGPNPALVIMCAAHVLETQHDNILPNPQVC